MHLQRLGQCVSNQELAREIGILFKQWEYKLIAPSFLDLKFGGRFANRWDSASCQDQLDLVFHESSAFIGRESPKLGLAMVVGSPTLFSYLCPRHNSSRMLRTS